MNEEIVLRVLIAYRMGYKDGVAAMAGVLKLEADMNLMKSIPTPVVPELNLSYTIEECAPLPPEEFLESDDEELKMLLMWLPKVDLEPKL